jgi:glycosyltransferase involved in cell wall biosynthesis
MRTLKIAACPHSYDGSSYYRIWLPFTHLFKNSRHILGVKRPEADVPPVEIADQTDVMVFQKPAGPHGTLMLETFLGHTKMVYEYDDDLLNVESAGLPHLYNDRARESLRRCLRLCDMVTVSNPHLAEMVRPYNDNIVVLPNHIKAGLLDINRPRRDRLTIGWAGGDTHSWDVEEVRDPLRDIVWSNPDVDIHFIGANHSPIIGRPCRWTAWEQDVGHYYKHVDFDIAVAPSWDNLFNRSKTWLRALEMGALGIPVVASNRLPYSEYVIDGKTGFLVNSPEEWQARLRDLIHDPQMREEMGAAGKEQAAGWTIEEGWRLWEAAYEGVVDDG